MTGAEGGGAAERQRHRANSRARTTPATCKGPPPTASGCPSCWLTACRLVVTSSLLGAENSMGRAALLAAALRRANAQASHPTRAKARTARSKTRKPETHFRIKSLSRNRRLRQSSNAFRVPSPSSRRASQADAAFRGQPRNPASPWRARWRISPARSPPPPAGSAPRGTAPGKAASAPAALPASTRRGASPTVFSPQMPLSPRATV